MSNPHLDQFLDLCRRVYERMLREGTAPWPDNSEESKSMLKSGDNPKTHE